MPHYQFKARDGEELVEFFEFKDCPEVGSYIEREGKRYRRIMSTGVMLTAAPEYHFKSQQVGDHDELAPHRDSEGVAAFTCKAEVDKFIDASRGNMERGGIGWNLEGRRTRDDRGEESKAAKLAKRERAELKALMSDTDTTVGESLKH